MVQHYASISVFPLLFTVPLFCCCVHNHPYHYRLFIPPPFMQSNNICDSIGADIRIVTLCSGLESFIGSLLPFAGFSLVHLFRFSFAFFFVVPTPPRHVRVAYNPMGVIPLSIPTASIIVHISMRTFPCNALHSSEALYTHITIAHVQTTNGNCLEGTSQYRHAICTLHMTNTIDYT